MEKININDCVLVGHAIGSGDFKPQDFGSWIEFWENQTKYSLEEDDWVGAHVVDADGKIYITPRPNEENFEMGQTKEVKVNGRIFLVPKEFLVLVKMSDTQTDFHTWKEFVNANKNLCDYIKQQDKEDYADQCLDEYYN